MTESTQPVSDEQRVYEVSYLLVPTIAEDALPQHVGAVKEVIEQYTDTFIEEEYPQHISLAYAMEHTPQGQPKKRFTSAYFGWLKFELDPTHVADIERALAQKDDMIRFLCVKTVRERTVATKRSYKEETLKNKQQKEEQAPLDEAQVDEKIDALVDEETGGEEE